MDAQGTLWDGFLSLTNSAFLEDILTQSFTGSKFLKIQSIFVFIVNMMKIIMQEVVVFYIVPLCI